jgi:hypothetical protein
VLSVRRILAEYRRHGEFTARLPAAVAVLPLRWSVAQRSARPG